MSKYIKEKLGKEFLLSELKDFDTQCFDKKDIIVRTEYLIKILGDVYMEEEIYYLFIAEFQRSGGRYDVRTKTETLKDIYDITRKYSFLTKDAIEEIWFTYIRDFYQECSILDVFDKYIKVFGKTDEMFKLFLDYVLKKTDGYQLRYIEESLKVDELSLEYSEDFIGHLKSLILRQHYSYDEISKYLPSCELIKLDEKHISEISRKERIFFGCCIPVSYSMFDILLREKTLDDYIDTPTYYISFGGCEQATFTKKEFLDSIEQRKVKKLKK